MKTSTAREWFIIGGDYIATIGKRQASKYAPGTCGNEGIGKPNEAGKELVPRQRVAWTDSFYPVAKRKT